MNESKHPDNRFVGYEYKEITVDRSLEGIYADGYANFGWKLDGTDTASRSQPADSVHMRFKRDRKIVNKAELTRLQRQFEACAQEIASMERNKTSAAVIAAFTAGLIGTVFLGGSVFAYLGGLLPFSIVLAVPGFLGWILPYFLYCRVRRSRTEALTPLIEQKYDEIYSVCEKASGLLA